MIRNEREVKIVDTLGRAFEPDFVLFCLNKNKQNITYQVFIEPKGGPYLGQDKWKEAFLLKMRKKKETMKIKSDKYIITAVPFYSNRNENEFKEEFKKTFS